MKGHGINHEGEELILYSDGSMYWKSRQTLILADVHLGKTNHFRKNGIAIPLEVQKQNFDNLSRALERDPIMDVFILGDLFHSVKNKSWDKFADFVQRHAALNFHLIVGNHDIIEKEDFEKIGVNVYAPQLDVGPFTFQHYPTDEPQENYVMCGHVHPCVCLKGHGKQKIRLRCFYLTSHQMILPAFGGFTGNGTITPNRGDSVYVIAGNEVLLKHMEG